MPIYAIWTSAGGAIVEAVNQDEAAKTIEQTYSVKAERVVHYDGQPILFAEWANPNIGKDTADKIRSDAIADHVWPQRLKDDP